MSTKFYVIAKETKTVQCWNCGGHGKVEAKQYHNRYEVVVCPVCNGTKEIELTNTTEVELNEALKQIGDEQ